jgi:uncharacterized repeat protein (TIGR01451 family)
MKAGSTQLASAHAAPFLDRIRTWGVRGAVAIALVAAWPAWVSAQPAAASVKQEAVKINLTQGKVIKGGDGKEQFVDAATVKPGEVIEYRAVYTNRSKKPVSGLVATLPIPSGMEYVPKSAHADGHAAEAATVDGRYAPEPLMRKVKLADGRERLEPVPYSEYRSLRWTLGQLPADGAAIVKARAQVAPLAVQTAAANDASMSGAASASGKAASPAKP